MAQVVKTTILMMVLLTGLTGLAYPALVTVAAQVVFPHRANGSLIKQGDSVLGSELIGQPVSDPKYFWGRPSATSPAYNGASSSGSNLGPSNPALRDAIQGRVAALRQADPGNTAPVPVDLVTASGSGLDPHVSPAAAYYQASRVARARGLPEDRVRELVHGHIEKRDLGVLGEPVVNVLELNFALDHLASGAPSKVLVGHAD